MKWLAVLTVLAVLILLPAVALAESASGTFGNLTWELDDAGTLVIRGEGEMENTGDAGWRNYASSIKKVEISEGVTSIGDSAFDGCSSLKSVTIPSSVTSIKDCAFYDCSSMTSVTIPSSVTSIGQSAFANCTNLTSVTIPEGVTSIGEYAFANCSSLTSVTIPEGVTSIGDAAFIYCTSLSSVTIPDSVTSIGEHAFYSCSSLSSVTIPDSVTSIGRDAFAGCSLNAIHVDTLEQWLGYDHSNNNGGLQFQTRGSLYVGGKLLTEAVIPDGVTAIGEYAFSGCSVLKSVTIPEGVTSIGDWAFYSCSSLTSVTIPDSVTSIGEYAFYSCSSMTSVTIPSSVTSIKDCAFYDCTSLTSVTIPSSVTSIGQSAFANCTNLTSVTIPDGVTSIGYSAFANCYGLTSVTIPDSLTSIGKYAFSNCGKLSVIHVDTLEQWLRYDHTYEGLQFQTSGSLYVGGKLLTDAVIPDSVTSIGEYAFQNCGSLTSVTIPDSVTSIGEHAFYDCSSLTSVTIPDSVTSIGKYAFSNCSKLSEIHVDTLEQWLSYDHDTGLILSDNDGKGGSLYVGGELLTDLVIPDGITSIGNRVFWYCTSLTSVTIPDSVTSIGKYAFSNCSKLSEIHVDTLEQWLSYDHDTGLILSDNDGKGGSLYVGGELLTDLVIPDGITSIGNRVFWNCTSLTSVTIPEGVTSIGEYAFLGCPNLMGVIIPESVTSIEYYAFEHHKLCEIHVDTLEQWLSYDHVHAGLSLNSSGSLYVGGKLLTDLVIPEGVTSIGAWAFYNCTSLTSVTIPDSVTSIGQYAFCCCSSLTGVTIPESVTSIGQYAFDNCSSLMSITIPDSVTSIGHCAFSGCQSLTSVTIPKGVTRIESFVFFACYSLTDVTLPDSLTYIGEHAFSPTCLQDVYYGGDRIDRSAMTICSYNDDLLNATWHYRPSGSCGENLQYSIDNTGLLSISGSGSMNAYSQDFHPWDESCINAVKVGADVTMLTDYAFYGCTNLKKIFIEGFLGEFGVNLVNGLPTVYCYQWSNADYWAQDNGFPIVYVDAKPFSDYGTVFAYVDNGDESMERSITLYRGESCQLIATFFPQLADLHPSWSSSDEAIATVDINGRVTTHAAGDVTITVDVEGVTSSVSIHVNGFGDVGSLTIENAPKYLQIGQSVKLKPVPTPADDSLHYTWWYSNEGVFSVDSNGVVTALKNGSATITVKAEGIESSVDIYACTPITSLTLPAEAWGIAASASPIRWAYEPADANPVLSWTSKMPAHATAKVTVTDDGVVTCSIPGDVVITLTDDVTGLSAQAIMHVMTPVKKIEVPESLTADACIGQIQYAATVTTVRNDVLVNKLVDFSIDDADVAEIDADGRILVKAPGTAVITVTAASGVTASTTLTVNPAHSGRTTTNAVDPGCVTQGNSAYDTCDTCGRFFVLNENELVEVEKDSWIIDATGHVSKTKTEAVDKTCTKDGNEAYWTCDACGWYLNAADEQIEKDSWIIPASHGEMQLTDAVDPTCTGSGNSEYYTCPDCGLFFVKSDEGFVEVEENSWVLSPIAHANKTLTEAVDPTCTKPGNSEYYTCDDCGLFFVKSDEGFVEVEENSWIIDPTGHVSKTRTDAVDPTCIEPGNSEYYSCPDCGLFFVKSDEGFVEVEENSWVIDPTAHANRTKTDAVDPTCTESGNSEYYTCPDCGLFFNAEGEEIAENSWVIDPIAHANKTLTEAVDPTCTESGNSEYYTCPDCGLFFNAEGVEIAEGSWVIPKLGYHQMMDNACIICDTHFDFASMNVLTLPAGLTRIEDEAFCGISAQVIVVPEGCLSIGHNAFADCEALRYVVLPASQVEIARDAFGTGAAELIVLCSEEAE